MEPKKPALSNKTGSEKKAGPWRPTKRQVLWVIGMVVALLTTALLIVNLYPEIWKGLLEERNLKLIAIGVSVTAIIVLLAIAGARRSWTGFQGKTVWDFLQLLIVPLMLVAIGLVFSLQQDARQQRVENKRAEAERELAEQRAQDEALQAYLDQMSQLMLARNLLEAEPGDPVHTLAQARTSTVILRLDAEHNVSVTRFLINSGLAVSGEASARLLRKIALSDATLSGAYLKKADLSRASLNNADLSGASLYRADLSGVVLSDADLSGAYLKKADLSAPHLSANLSEADLSEADLSDANLSAALLSHAILDRADLSGAILDRADLNLADLSDADLSGADLSGAEGITNEELEQQADTLEGATMPNGQKYEDWLKGKNREEGGKNDGSS